MTTQHTSVREEWLSASARSAADWLPFAGAPTFAAMAMLAAIPGATPDALCMHGASPLSGMVPMYLLMSAFHAAPWLKLVSGGVRRNTR